MLVTAIRVYQQGRELSEAELRAAASVGGDVRTQTVQINGKAVLEAACIGGSKNSLLPLIEAQTTGISPLALGLEGYEEARTPEGDRVLPAGLVVQERAEPLRGQVDSRQLRMALSSLSTLKRNLVGSR